MKTADLLAVQSPDQLVSMLRAAAKETRERNYWAARDVATVN